MKKLSLRIKNPKVAKRLKKAAITLLVVFVFFGCIGIFMGYYYEDTVKRIIINELNKRLNTEIIVQDVNRDIQFSIFKKFPYASVSFNHVIILDAIADKKNKKNLLEAKSVSLEFSIWNMLFGEYHIKRIAIDEAIVLIKTYKDRSDNYHFWKPSTDTASSKFSFDLQKVVLNKVKISYIDYGRQQNFTFLVKEALFKGRFSDVEYTLDIDGDIYVQNIKSGNELYLANKGSVVDATLYINSKEKYLSFKESSIAMGKLVFSVGGNISYADSLTYTDLQIDGKKMRLQSFVNELPPQYRSYFNGYECSGDFYFQASIKGYVGNNATPAIYVSFGLSKGEIVRSENAIALKNVGFSAVYSNGAKHEKQTSRLNITGFSSSLNDGTINGNVSIHNFLKPEIELKVSANLGLKDFIDFIKLDTIESADGRIVVQADFKGIIENSDRFTMKDFISSTCTGKMDLENANIILKGKQQKFMNLNGNFVFNNNDVESQNFTGSYMSNDFSLKGRFINILPYLFLENQNLIIDADLVSQNLDLGEILKFSENRNDTVYKLRLPDNIGFNLTVQLKNFVFKKFSAKNISGTIIMKNKQLIAKDISLQAVNGKIDFAGLIDGSQPDKLLISCDASIKKVTIQRLFYELENFGQKSLQDNNLKGVLTADVQFASVWSSTLTVEKRTIYAKANIVIENGELIDYEPLKGLSKYLKNRDLSHVAFQTLKNTIVIKDQLITIPDMEINSTAINFKLNGTHGFDQTIDYHLSVLISQLKNSGEHKNDKVEDIGQIIDDGLHKEKYFFRITGTVDKPIYRTLDKDGYKENMKENLVKEKENLKTILNREFGWFKKDSTLNKNIKPKDKYDFNVIWDEEDAVEKKEK
ncbi:MAG: AsmA-like C-terminal region-containing protein [Bacteroidota bacterium]